MAFLQIASGKDRGRLFEIHKSLTVVGSREGISDVVLNIEGVSRRHASIRKVEEDYYLLDLESKNGTFLNNVQVAAGSELLLSPTDRVTFCDVECIFHLVHPAARTPTDKYGEIIAVVDDSSSDETKMQLLDTSRPGAMTSAALVEVKLKAMIDIARSLSADLKIDLVAPKILDTLIDLFPRAERFFLILIDPETKQLVRKAFKSSPKRDPNAKSGGTEEELPTSISRSIVDHVIGRKQAILSEDAGNDKNLSAGVSVSNLRIRSVMCAPLLTPEGEALGILQVDTSDRRQFSQDDLELLLALASQFAIAIRYAKLHESLVQRERFDFELENAKKIHSLFLPRSLPEIPGYEFFAYYLPAYAIGGDFYDFVPLADSRLAMALGDVTGKGIAAALMMAKFSGSTRQCFLTKSSPGPAADALNNMVCDAAIDERFITMFLAVLDFENHRLTMSSAGHPALLRRAEGGVEELGDDFRGIPLGMTPNFEYAQETIELAPGDVVIIYSDGVSDAQRKAATRAPEDEFYDTRKNRRLLTRVVSSEGNPSSVGRDILSDIREFTAGHPQFDDTTLICFGRLR